MSEPYYKPCKELDIRCGALSIIFLKKFSEI